MKKLIIAIDGPVGSGKSTVARRVAELLDYMYLDTGAMYRAVALAATRRGVSTEDVEKLEALAGEVRIELEPTTEPTSGAKALPFSESPEVAAQAATHKPEATSSSGGVRVLLDGEDVSEEIRSPEMSQAASMIAQVPAVREQMVEQQRRAGARGGVVMEGRDIGTVVFPGADLKIFLTAGPEIRAWRRLRDHQARGESLAFEEMLEEIHLRDRRDRERSASPLVRAPDAVLVDSSAMEMEEVAGLIVMMAKERETVTSGE
jgi:cytidylate kinase